MKDLQLSLIGKWFYMTRSGIKTEDYREINEYWLKRLFEYISEYPLSDERLCDILISLKKGDFKNTTDFWGFSGFYPKKFNTNIMTLGYPKKGDPERTIQLEHKGISIDYGNPEWGAEPGKLYFIIKHGKLL